MSDDKRIIIKDKQILKYETLFRQRNLFIYEPISDTISERIVAELMTLDLMNQDPIYLHINSPGGSVDAGFDIIDTIRNTKSPVITIARGNVASMATLIFISGKERHAFKNTTFMFHDIFGGVIDYGKKMEDRVDFLKKNWEQIIAHVKLYTKMSDEDIKAMRNGEIWYFAEDALAKGVTDKII